MHSGTPEITCNYSNYNIHHEPVLKDLPDEAHDHVTVFLSQLLAAASARTSSARFTYSQVSCLQQDRCGAVEGHSFLHCEECEDPAAYNRVSCHVVGGRRYGLSEGSDKHSSKRTGIDAGRGNMQPASLRT